MFAHSKLLKQKRLGFGLTQAALSELSGVSLPSIQNIEAGKGNPSWDVLCQLAKALGLQVRIEQRSADWDFLSSAGVPIASDRRSSKTPIALRSLLRELTLAAEEVSSNKSMARELEALQAFVLALKLHFPTAFKRYSKRCQALHLLDPKMITGRHVKLARVARDRIAGYL